MCAQYPGFNAGTKQLVEKVRKELSRDLTRTQGWEAVIRIRASKGVQVVDFHGNFYLRGSDLLALPGVDSDKAFTFELRNDESVLTERAVCVQSALLYTTSEGERRIRVHSLCLPLSANLLELYDRVNCNAMINVMVKHAIRTVYMESLDKAREAVRNRTVVLLRTYRSLVAKGNPQSQELVLLPLMTLGALKCLAFKEGSDVRSDVRAYVLSILYTMGIVELETVIRPRMLPVHNLSGPEGLPATQSTPAGPDDPPVITLPQESALTAEVLQPDAAYLLDNGLEFLLRVGKAVNPAWLQSLFGVGTLQNVDAKTLTLREDDGGGPAGTLGRVRAVMDYLRAVSSHYQCFGTDTRVLTSHGLLFLDELQELISNGAEVKYAAFDKASQTLQYVTGVLLVNAAEPKGRLVSFAAPSERERFAHPGPLKPTWQDARCNYTSIRVTPDHDMFVQQAMGPGKLEPTHPAHAKMKAGRLMRDNRGVRFMALAAQGVQPSFCTFTLSDVLRCTLGLLPHHIAAFLELYGFWLGDGTVGYNVRLHGYIVDCVQFSQKKKGDNEFLRAQFAACGLTAREWHSSPSADGREVLQVVRPCWREYFDQSYGVKYRHSHYYDKKQALLKQGMRRTQPRPPPVSADSTTQSLRNSSAVDLAEEDVKMDDTGAIAPPPSVARVSSSPLSRATTAQSSSTSRSHALSNSSSSSSGSDSAVADIPDPPLFCWQCGDDEWIDWDAGMRFWQCWRCAAPAEEERDEEPPASDDDTPMKDEPLPPSDDVPLVPEEDDEPPALGDPPTDDDDPVKSAKWLLWWVLLLCTPAQCRLILRGVLRADGKWSAQSPVIFTSGVQFRDELVQLALHAGYSAHFTCDYTKDSIRGYHKLRKVKPKRGGKYERGIFKADDITPATAHLFVPIVAQHDHWRVHYTDVRRSGQTWPSINWDGDSIKEEPYSDVTWCVAVDHADHLIVAQRALRDENGKVYKASRPLIIGQCVFVVKEGEAAEVRFFNLLIEDRNHTAMSLSEFEQFIVRQNY